MNNWQLILNAYQVLSSRKFEAWGIHQLYIQFWLRFLGRRLYQWVQRSNVVVLIIAWTDKWINVSFILPRWINWRGKIQAASTKEEWNFWIYYWHVPLWLDWRKIQKMKCGTCIEWIIYTENWSRHVPNRLTNSVIVSFVCFVWFFISWWFVQLIDFFWNVSLPKKKAETDKKE